MRTTTPTGRPRKQCQERVSMLPGEPPLTTVLCAQLSQAEKDLLQTHEQTITNGLATFFEVGNALMEIKEAHLYRSKYSSFDFYCQERWGFGRTYAWRVIAAAERLKLLPNDGTTRKPSNEFQMRPFLKLAPEAFPGVWKQVIERAKDGKITSELIGGLIKEIDSSRHGKKNAGAHPRKVCLTRGTLGEIIILIDQAKRHIEKSQSDLAIEQLERIERLLIS